MRVAPTLFGLSHDDVLVYDNEERRANGDGAPGKLNLSYALQLTSFSLVPPRGEFGVQLLSDSGRL